MVQEIETHSEIGVKKPAKKGFWEKPRTRRDFLKWSIRAGAGLVTLTGGWSLLRKFQEKKPLSTLVSKEFTPEMIKNRLYLEGKELPMWYVGEWGFENDASIVSGVVAASPKIGPEEGTGIYSNKEIIIPVAFQNPATKEFFVRNLSLGFRDIITHTSIIDLKNYQLLDGLSSGDGIHYEDSNYLLHEISPEQVVNRLNVGDQIAFTLTTTKERFYGYLPKEGIEKIPQEIKNEPYFQKLERELVSNNTAVIKAMRGNKDLPELTIYPTQFFVNK